MGDWIIAYLFGAGIGLPMGCLAGWVARDRRERRHPGRWN